MEEKINLVKKYKMSVDPVIYNLLGKRVTKPEDEYCLAMGRKIGYSRGVGMEITIKIKGTISKNTITFFVDNNNLDNINFEEIEFICKRNKKVDDLITALYNFIKENNCKIEKYKECV